MLAIPQTQGIETQLEDPLDRPPTQVWIPMDAKLLLLFYLSNPMEIGEEDEDEGFDFTTFLNLARGSSILTKSLSPLKNQGSRSNALGSTFIND